MPLDRSPIAHYAYAIAASHVRALRVWLRDDCFDHGSN